MNNSADQITIPIIEELVEKVIYEYTAEDSLESLTKIDRFTVKSEITIDPYGFKIFEVINK